MLTDAPPRSAKAGAGFQESDRIRVLELPPSSRLPEIAAQIGLLMKTAKAADVRRACEQFLGEAAAFYGTPACGIRVLAARPLNFREQWVMELFGDYDPATMQIRLWMRTAVRKEVTSFGTFLNTLCHEFCHHLDFHRFGFGDSWHTRGFFERTAVLYHHARATEPKKLFWVPLAGGRWRIDWQRTRRGA